LYYYENVAESKGDPVRQADIKRVGGKLKDILVAIEQEIEGALMNFILPDKQLKETCVITAIDNRVTQLKNAAAVLFDTPDLQKLRVRERHKHYLFQSPSDVAWGLVRSAGGVHLRWDFRKKAFIFIRRGQG
jgi:hypothetical protein